MLQPVVSYSNYTLYHDTTRGNYKLHNGSRIIANPSTIEDAMNKFNMITNPSIAANKCKGCNCYNCNDCDKYV